MKVKFAKRYGPFSKGAIVEGDEKVRPGQIYQDDAKEGLSYKVVLFVDKLLKAGIVKKVK
jgi:hypothetical protein